MSFSGKTALTTLAPMVNDGFWPDLAIAELIDGYRIPPEYADAVIITGLKLSAIRVNELLDDAKTEIKRLGHANFAAYASADPLQINNSPVVLECYKSAVFSRAKAFLLQQFNSLNRKPEAENAAKESRDTEVFWLDASQINIQMLIKRVLPNANTPSKAGVYVAML